MRPAPWDRMEKVIKYVDLVLFDLKHMNAIIHKERTGVSNELILANVRKAASMVRVWLRIPVIPGFNDSHSDMQEMAKFASSLALEKVSLLPYHSWGESKYHRLGKTYPMHGIESPSEQHQEDG